MLRKEEKVFSLSYALGPKHVCEGRDDQSHGIAKVFVAVGKRRLDALHPHVLLLAVVHFPVVT